MKDYWFYIIIIVVLVLIKIFGNFDSPSKSYNYLEQHGIVQTEKRDYNVILIYKDNDSVYTDEEKHHIEYLKNYYYDVNYEEN